MRPRFSYPLLAAVAGLVVGCTGGGAHPSDPPITGKETLTHPSTASDTPTPTRTGFLTTGPGVKPGEKPPVLSDLARKHTNAGAVEFIYYFYEVETWSLLTSDPYPLEQVSLLTCKSCQSLIGKLRALATEPGHLTGGRIRARIVGLRTGAEKHRAEYVYEIQAHQEPIVAYHPTSVTTEAGSAADTQWLYVAWDQNAWKVAEIGGP